MTKNTSTLNKPKVWIARDKDNFLGIYHIKPLRVGDNGERWGTDYDTLNYQEPLSLDNEFFPELKWEDDAVPVELKQISALSDIKTQMNDLMLDLETWGCTHDSVIIQVGACYFDSHTGEIGDKLSINIDVNTSLREGFTVTGNTLYWWFNQAKEAQRLVTANPRVPVREAMLQVNQFLANAKHIWSHATFDYVMLVNHLQKLNITPTFSYRSPRDLRTLTNLAKIYVDKEERVGTHHNAIDDCIYQVGYTVKCLNKLRSK